MGLPSLTLAGALRLSSGPLTTSPALSLYVLEPLTLWFTLRMGLPPLQTACRSPPSFHLIFPSSQIPKLCSITGGVSLHTPASPGNLAVNSAMLIPQARMWKLCLVAACAQDRTQKAKQPVFATFNQTDPGRVACRYDCLFAI